MYPEYILVACGAVQRLILGACLCFCCCSRLVLWSRTALWVVPPLDPPRSVQTRHSNAHWRVHSVYFSSDQDRDAYIASGLAAMAARTLRAGAPLRCVHEAKSRAALSNGRRERSSLPAAATTTIGQECVLVPDTDWSTIGVAPPTQPSRLRCTVSAAARPSAALRNAPR